MIKIIKDLSNNKNHFSGVNPCNYITIHQTGNFSIGANAKKHSQLLKNGFKSTWHITVDDTQAIQHFNYSTQCWHAGDGRGNGNTQSIGIELCVNSDGDYIQTLKNGADVVKQLMKLYNIPIENVVQHNKWSGKNCPEQIRNCKNNVCWNDFINMIQQNNSVEKYVSLYIHGVKSPKDILHKNNKTYLQVDGNLIEVRKFFEILGYNVEWKNNSVYVY